MGSVWCGEGVAALLPVAFPASVISMVLLMVLLLTGVGEGPAHPDRLHFSGGQYGLFSSCPSFVGLLEHIELLKSQLVPLLLIIVLTTPVVYLITGWTVRLLMLRHRNRKEDRHA